MNIKLAVLGQNDIEKYSLSPLIHNTFLKENNINGEYIAIPVEQYNIGTKLKELLVDGYTGVNLTIPHKVNAIKFLDGLDDTAVKIGAVNTVLFKDNKIIGYNTDCYGFIENLNTKINDWKKNNKVLIIGAGGATRAVIYGLQNNGINNITIVNRTLEKAKLLSNEFNCKYEKFENIDNIIKLSNLIVNTTSAGMNNLNSFEIDFKNTNNNTIVYDIVYAPLLTNFLKKAKNFNLKTVDGLGMLLFQAAKAFKIWFYIKPNITDKLILNCEKKLNENSKC